MNTLQDRIRGSLIGGAIGDALGYPVEFNSYTDIINRYGERGITRLETKQSWLSEDKQSGKAIVSDDTQMTLFTANGLLNAPKLGIEPKFAICRAYLEWLIGLYQEGIINRDFYVSSLGPQAGMYIGQGRMAYWAAYCDMLEGLGLSQCVAAHQSAYDSYMEQYG